MAFARSPDFKTPVCRLSFGHTLFKPRRNDRNVLKYGCTLIFPKTDMLAKTCKFEDGRMTSLQDIVAGVIVEQWGEAGLKKAKAGVLKSPFLAGDGKEARDKNGDIRDGLGADMFFIRPTANEDRAPKVFSSPSAAIPGTQEDVYSGCFGFAVLNAYAWKNDQGGEGVSFGIQMFFKKADGERLGGGESDPDRWAETIDDAGEAPESTKTGAGASGLFG